MKALARHVQSNVVAYLALFVAVGGTGYAALRLPPNSVGGRQIRNHSIKPNKFNPKYIAGSIRAWVNVQWRGNRLVAAGSSSRVRVVTASDGEEIVWPKRRFRRNCMPMVTPRVNFTAPTKFDGSVTADFDPTSRTGATLILNGFGPNGAPRAQASYVVIVCP
jgi:hypothetical protein